MLRSRVFHRLPFTPLPADHMPTLMRGYYSAYAQADEQLLAQIDDTFAAHGSLGLPDPCLKQR